MEAMTSLRNRWLLFFGISAALLAAQSVAYPALTPPPPPPSPPQPSYELSNFKIQYPYVGPRDEYVEPSADRRTQAAVSYDSVWAGDSFPGLADCVIVLYGDAGQLVGRMEVELKNYAPRAPGGKAFWPPIEVSEPPASAGGSCEDSIHPEDGL